MLEEELTHKPTPATPKPVKDIDIDTLEFDIGENSTTPSTSKETDDFDLDIDSLANTEQNSQDTALDDFASSFDEPKVSTDNTALLDDDLLLGDDLLSQTSNQTESDDLLLGDDFLTLNNQSHKTQTHCRQTIVLMTLPLIWIAQQVQTMIVL